MKFIKSIMDSIFNIFTILVLPFVYFFAILFIVIDVMFVVLVEGVKSIFKRRAK